MSATLGYDEQFVLTDEFDAETLKLMEELGI